MIELNTIWKLSYNDEGGIIEEDEKIKVSLKNGEVLIGEYKNSDWTSLTIERDNFEEAEIEFEDVEDIEKLD